MAERKVHGPIFQFECEVCDYMGDCWDTEAEAVADMEAHDCVACAPAWVRDEIERLHSAVAIAAGMLSTREPYTDWHPEAVMQMIMEEARRG